MEPNTVIRCIRLASLCVFLALFLYFVGGAVVSLVGAARLDLTAQISHALSVDASALDAGALDAGALDAGALSDILTSACSF